MSGIELNGVTLDALDALAIGGFLEGNFEALAAQFGGAEAERLIALFGSNAADHCEEDGQ